MLNMADSFLEDRDLEDLFADRLPDLAEGLAEDLLLAFDERFLELWREVRERVLLLWRDEVGIS